MTHCCEAMKGQFDEYDRPDQGWWVSVKPLHNINRHYLRFRSVAKSNEAEIIDRIAIRDENAKPHPDGTIIIESEAALIYCPWCGTKLE